MKSFYRPESKDAYREAAAQFRGVHRWTAEAPDWMEDATVRHLGCPDAGVDGKSPAEYLTGESLRKVHDFARQVILHPPVSVEELFACL